MRMIPADEFQSEFPSGAFRVTKALSGDRKSIPRRIVTAIHERKGVTDLPMRFGVIAAEISRMARPIMSAAAVEAVRPGGTVVLLGKDLAIGYAERQVAAQIDLEIDHGSRAAVVGGHMLGAETGDVRNGTRAESMAVSRQHGRFLFRHQSRLPQLVGRFGLDRRCRSGVCWGAGSEDVKSCRHTTSGVSLDSAWSGGFTGGHVPAGDAAHESGRDGGALPAVGAQRAQPTDRGASGEGDPQLRSGGVGGPGRAGASGGLDLPVPRSCRRGRGELIEGPGR